MTVLFVYRLGHSPFKAERRVQFPQRIFLDYTLSSHTIIFMFQRRNLYLKRIKQFDANPTKSLTHRQQRLRMRKNRIFSALTQKSYSRRVMMRAEHLASLHPDASQEFIMNRGHPTVYPMEVWKYQRQKWFWNNPSAVPGLLKIQKLKFLALHQRYAVAILRRWLYHRSPRTWIRWLQQLQWNQWAWVQRLEHLPNNFLTKVGWFNHPKEAMMWIKRNGVQLNSFPKGKLRVKSYTTQPGDVWSFASLQHYHQHLTRHSQFWVEQWSTPMKQSVIIYL